MRGPVTFTLDLEDHRPDDSFPLRYPTVMREVLAFLAERNVVGTVFVVGVVAEAQPDLVREVAAAGHEIALHSWAHTHLTDQTPEVFAAETRRGKALLEDLAGAPVVGFRAPTFSLVPDSLWATEVLAEEGFTYSSSVLSAPNPLFGYPGAPTEPFVWPSGLAEFPAPLAGIGPVHVPFLGGTYFRLLPWPVIAAARRFGDVGPAPWTYVHPYDFDTEERYWPVPDAGRLAPLLWVGRRRALAKMDRLLAAGAGLPLRDRIADAVAGGVFGPATSAATTAVGAGAAATAPPPRDRAEQR